VPKLVWRVKLAAELQPGVATETEVARIERDVDANLAQLSHYRVFGDMKLVKFRGFAGYL